MEQVSKDPNMETGLVKQTEIERLRALIEYEWSQPKLDLLIIEYPPEEFKDKRNIMSPEEFKDKVIENHKKYHPDYEAVTGADDKLVEELLITLGYGEGAIIMRDKLGW